MKAVPDNQLDQRASDLQEPDLHRMYRLMALARTISRKAWLLNRQGEVFFTMPCDGQEAADVGSAYALRPGQDLVIPYARDMAAVLTLGMTAREIMLNLLARRDDPNGGGRQMPMHWGSRRLGIISMGSTVGITLPKAVGVALAAKLRGEDTVTLVYFGDGASSQGDFHEALNFAGIIQAPVVFFCNNNGWAASVPFSKQTAGPDIASRAKIYGLPGVLVDGTDPIAVYQATLRAVERARRGEGPTLIEARSPRLMPHSSTDDHTLYRTDAELEEDQQLDPLPRFRDYLVRQDLWSAEADQNLWAELDEETETAIRYAQAAPLPSAASALDNVYANAKVGVL